MRIHLRFQPDSPTFLTLTKSRFCPLPAHRRTTGKGTMAYNTELADRTRRILRCHKGLEEKRMFGGVALLMNGNMACGVLNDDVILRIGPAAYEGALREYGVREFDVTGRPMTGWVMIGPEVHADDDVLADWIRRAATFAATLSLK